MNIYHHTQRGTILPIMLGASVVVIAIGLSAGRDITPLLVVAAVLIVTALLFASLTVDIKDDMLKLAFGPGLVHKRTRLADIQACAVVRNLWWYGWGIRLTPHGWLYNVAGLSAVEVTLKGGRRFRIGTDEPEQLYQALLRAMSEAPK